MAATASLKRRKPTKKDLDIKREFIRDYFDERRRQLESARQLIDNPEYLLEGLLVLCCHIDSYAGLRFPLLKNRQAYKEVVIRYSGKQSFFEKIDLLFFYQWRRSYFGRYKDYTAFKDYGQVKRRLVSLFGDESEVRKGKRYVAPTTIVDCLGSRSLRPLDKRKLRRKLQLFSVGEQLYRYLRSFAVHNMLFPFLNRAGDRYEPNHILTPDVLYETAEAILANLERECLAKAKFPHQLRQKRKSAA